MIQLPFLRISRILSSFATLALIFCDLNFGAKFKTGFYAGRVKPGPYEYSKNNGWMTPQQAVEICEKDVACGGFTFKGAYR